MKTVTRKRDIAVLLGSLAGGDRGPDWRSTGLSADLDPDTAVIKVSYLDAKAREFDFARDRHIAAADVEEYLGRRVVELIRSVQKATPW